MYDIFVWKIEEQYNLSKNIRQVKSTRKFLHSLKVFPNFSFVCFQWKINRSLVKENKKVKTESAIELTLSPLFGIHEFQHPPLLTPLNDR